MDQALIASFRKSLEAKSTEELRQAYEIGNQSSRSPEEIEATRQILEERRRKSTRATLAIGSAIVFGSLGAACAWWQGADGAYVFLAAVVCAILGFGSWYIPDLIPWVRV